MALRRSKGEGGLIRRAGCRYWYAQFQDAAGKQVRVSTKKDVKAEALVVLRRLMGRAENGESFDGKLHYSDLRTALLANYVERGNKSLETRADGTETIVGLAQLDKFCGYEPDKPDQPGIGSPGLPLARITTDLTRAFVKARMAEDPPAGPAMINRSLQCLRRGLNLLHEERKIAAVPKIRLLKEPGPRKGFLEREKFAELLGALPGYLRPLVALLYWCGLRKGEALAVEWDQVDLERRTITLHDDQTKNSEPRIVPLPSEVVAMLRPLQPKHGKVFDGANLRTEWETACARVGLGTRVRVEGPAGYSWHKYSGLIIHDLRRSAVRNLRLAGVPEGVAMRISGHKTRAVFERYNIVAADDVLAAMEQVEVAAAKALPPAGKGRRISAKSVQKKTHQVLKPA